MRPSKILAKIRAGKVARIVVFGHFIPYFPKLAAHFGYDGVWVDSEHRTFNPRDAQALLAFHQLADIDCIWRASTLEKTGLYRLLEDGATGLMIPHVSTAEKARALVQATKFPPLGDRGMDGAGLDSGFYVGGGTTYVQDANRETCLVVQIETPEAVANVEEIAAVPGVDVLFLGPGDLSLRLGCSAEVNDPAIMNAQKKVAAAAKKHKKAWGRPVSNVAEAKCLVKMGAQFIALGNEFAAIYNHLKGSSAELDQALGQKTSAKKMSKKIIA